MRRPALASDFVTSGEKDDGRSLQLRISIDLSRYLASIFPWHHYVQQDQVRPEIVGTLMSFDSVVLFEYDVAAFFFEKDFEQVCTVPVVINNQDASLFFHRRPPIECFVHRSPCGGVPSPNNPRKDGSDSQSDRIGPRTHTILSDRTLIRAPDCVSQLGCDSYAGCEHNPNRRPPAGERNCGTPEALGYRRAAISLADR